MNKESLNLVMIPQEELYSLRSTQKEILQQLKELRSTHAGSIPIKNITAIEFMKAVRICRTKFDELASSNKIRVIKKRRKIYVPVSEIDRYFNDPTIL